jgi:hypothetical protein
VIGDLMVSGFLSRTCHCITVVVGADVNATVVNVLSCVLDFILFFLIVWS